MSVWKRGSKYWGFFNLGGQRHQFPTGTANKKLAEAIVRKRRDELIAEQSGLPKVDPDLTNAELIVRFLAETKPSAYYHERIAALLPFFADLLVRQVGRGTAEAYRRYRHSQKKLTDATINREVAVLRRIYYWALDNRLLLFNPLSRVRLVRERVKRRAVLSVGEEAKLIAASAEHLTGIVITALDTGMRRGELLGQLFEHVDFERQVLSVTRSKTPEGEAREIPLSKRVAQLLSGQEDKDGLIFRYHDQPILRLTRSWKTAVTGSKIRPLRFHDLRHTFNTRLMEAGVGADIRMALMGHSRGGVHERYTHVDALAKREAIERLEQWKEQQFKKLKEEEEKQKREQEKGGKP